ncbi:MAG: serine/threonine protein kinase, partial [Proteobacteria bacterium]|nr:serine/threonine protein kinase [Pseudomonadota bacterium]
MQNISRQFGRYELLGRIARGGMGEIYLARFTGVAGFEKRCVIKKILPELASNQAFVDKFLDEGKTLVALTHSNIVQIFDMGCVNGEYYLAMEHIDGADLRFLLRQFNLRNLRMGIGESCYIILEVLKGLSYANRATDGEGKPLGVIHRDISPSNILISNEGEVKIIDFGIAKSELKTTESSAGLVQGKFAYMSPEQARGEALDARTDLFSLGVVFYEMLTGLRPFEGTSDLQSIEKIKTAEPPAITDLRADVPAALERIINRALSKSPEGRYKDADAFYEEVEDFMLDAGLKTKSRDLVAAFHPLIEGDQALVVHSSDDFFNDAFQALLDAEMPSVRGERTRSMCLTQSFSNELPKAKAEDFKAPYDSTGVMPMKVDRTPAPQRNTAGLATESAAVINADVVNDAVRNTTADSTTADSTQAPAVVGQVQPEMSLRPRLRRMITRMR